MTAYCNPSIQIPQDGPFTFYDGETQDWAMYYNGTYIGSRAYEMEALGELRQIHRDTLLRDQVAAADEQAEEDRICEERTEVEGMALVCKRLWDVGLIAAGRHYLLTAGNACLELDERQLTALRALLI